mmetsp:Transcript_125737/g.361476  ORF Transcript_125737/g.361476 Transcript_125737/m.361476 type:complete len:291 (+) Transcript_125737:508-1380(+)
MQGHGPVDGGAAAAHHRDGARHEVRREGVVRQPRRGVFYCQIVAKAHVGNQPRAVDIRQAPRPAAEAFPIRHNSAPSSSDRLCTERQSSRQEVQVCIEAMHRPRSAIRVVLVAQRPCLAKQNIAQTEQPEVHLRAAFPVRRLELEHGAADEIAALHLGRALHAFQVLPDLGFRLTVAAVLSDEPRDGGELCIVLRDELIDEVPRRLGVQAVDPPRPEGLPHLMHRCAGLIVLSPRRVVQSGDDVLKAENAWPVHLTVDRGPHRERPSDCELDTARRYASLLLRSEDSVKG